MNQEDKLNELLEKMNFLENSPTKETSKVATLPVERFDKMRDSNEL